LTKAEEKQVIDGLKSGHLPDFMTEGTRASGSPMVSGGDFSRAERKAGRDPVGTVAIGRENIYLLNDAKQWRKANVPNSTIASLLLDGTLNLYAHAQSGKTAATIYASESEAKKGDNIVVGKSIWIGDVLLPNFKEVSFKEIGDSWFYAENKKVIVDLIDRTRSGTSGSRKPKPKPETPSIAIAPKSTGIKMF